jgi:hypothetical protein
MRRYLLPAALLIAVLIAQPAPYRASAGDNLLITRLRSAYTQHTSPDGGGFVASGWTPWWFNDPGDVFAAPEFDIAPIERDPNRVRSGAAGQALFRPNVLFQAGVYQQVAVPSGALLELTIYGHAWSGFCQPGDPPLCNPSDSHYGQGANRVFMMVGIDPTGGTNPFSSTVQWSPQRVVWDHFEPFTVHTHALASTVTVFTWSATDPPRSTTSADDASLTVVARLDPAAGPGFQPNGTVNVRSGPARRMRSWGRWVGVWYPITGQKAAGTRSISGQTGWVLARWCRWRGSSPRRLVPQAVHTLLPVRSGPIPPPASSAS